MWKTKIPFDLESELHIKTSSSFVSEIYTLIKFTDLENFKKELLLSNELQEQFYVTIVNPSSSSLIEYT